MIVRSLARRGLMVATIGLLSAVAGNAWADSALRPEIEQLQGILTGIAKGESAFGPVVAPAETLATTQPKPDRIHDLNARLIEELNEVATAFNDAADDEKQAATLKVVKVLDPQTAVDGASRVFEGDGPSLSIMRQFLIVPAASLGTEPLQKAMAIVTSFERSPKTDDTYFEYVDPKDTAGSEIRSLPGSATSWNKAAQPSMTEQQLYKLKKCRSLPILGWYCNTSWYEPLALDQAPGGTAQALVTTLYPLSKGSDNPFFKDGRAENIVDGYTSVYLVEQSGTQILIYSLGFQTKAGSAVQQARLNAGHKAEFKMLASRFTGLSSN